MDELKFFTKVTEWVAAIPQIAGGVLFVADWEDILELQLDEATYPIAVAELPDFFADSENIWTPEAAICVLSQITQDEYSQETLISNMSANAMITKSLSDYMLDCGEANVHDISNIHPVTKATANNLYGWRFIFKMEF